MNRSFALALIVAASTAGNAFAENIADYAAPFASTATRAQVRSDAAQFRRSGANPWARDYNPIAQFRSTASRDQVTAEYIANRGQVAALSGEDSGSVYLARQRGAVVDTTQLAGQPRNAQ